MTGPFCIFAESLIIYFPLASGWDEAPRPGTYYAGNDLAYSNAKGMGILSRRRRGVMSEELKYELAKDLGFYDTVKEEGWGGIKAKDAGNMVKRAIQLAEQAASRKS